MDFDSDRAYSQRTNSKRPENWLTEDEVPIYMARSQNRAVHFNDYFELLVAKPEKAYKYSAPVDLEK